MTELPATTPSQTVGPFLAIALPWDDGPDMAGVDSITTNQPGTLRKELQATP